MARSNRRERGHYDQDEVEQRLQALRAELAGGTPHEPADELDGALEQGVDDTESTLPKKTDEEIAHEVAPSLVEFLDAITSAIEGDHARFVAKFAGSPTKKWSLVRARRAALVEAKAYAPEDIAEMTDDQVRLLFEAAYAAGGKTQPNPAKAKRHETEPLSDTSLEILARLERALAVSSGAPQRPAKGSKRTTKLPLHPNGGVNQSTLDRLEEATHAWEMGADDPDIAADARYRRRLANGTAPKGATSPAVTTPTLHETSAAPRAADPRMADFIRYDPLGQAYWTAKAMASEGEHAHTDQIDTILGGYDERQRQNTLYAEAQRVHAAVVDIDAEIAASPSASDVAIMRRLLVANHAFGLDAALEVGNMSDDEVKEFVSYMRTANKKATPPPAPVDDPLKALATGVLTESGSDDPLRALVGGTYVSSTSTPVDPLEALVKGTYVPVATSDILAALATGTYVPAAEAGTAATPEVLALTQELAGYRDTYARLTAKDRTSYFGRFLSDDSRRSRFLRRMPFVGRVLNSWNERQAEAIDDARLEYEVRLDNLNQLLAAPGPDIERGARQRRALLNESFQLESRISQFVKERGGGRAGAFTTWWMRQEGDTSKWKWRSRLKKVGAIAAISGTAAFGVSILAPGIIFGIATGSIVGGASGGLLGRSITRHRGNAKVAVGRGGEMSYADLEAAYSTNRQFDALRSNATPDATTLTSQVEEKSNEEMVRNRRRIRSTVAVGKLAGGLSGFGASQLRAHVAPQSEVASSVTDGNGESGGGQVDGGANPGADGEAAGPIDKQPVAPRAPELAGNTFNAEPGSGFTREWSQWANANGHRIDAHTAEQLHDAVRARFGDNGIITKLGTYVQNGDLRIARSGATSWANGVPEFAQQWLATRGKW